jgi:hypothetical protein
VKVWSFIFTDPSDALSSARVAAHDRAAAVAIMQQAVDTPLAAMPNRAPAPGVILQWIGEDEAETEPRVISAITRYGRQLNARKFQ